MASAPDTESIPGYTIFREGDYESVAAAAMLPQGTPHPLGKTCLCINSESTAKSEF
jgi:hypothetical protein